MRLSTIVFVVMALSTALCTSSAKAEKTGAERATAAAPCPDDSGMWCLAIGNAKLNFQKMENGMIAYGQTETRVIKMAVKFPANLKEWKISKADAVLATYNEDIVEQLEFHTDWYKVNQETKKLVAKKHYGTVEIKEAVTVKSSTSYPLTCGLMTMFMFLGLGLACLFYDEKLKSRYLLAKLAFVFSVLFCLCSLIIFIPIPTGWDYKLLTFSILGTGLGLLVGWILLSYFSRIKKTVATPTSAAT